MKFEFIFIQGLNSEVIKDVLILGIHIKSMNKLIFKNDKSWK